MALTIYDTQDWDSYVSLADAESYISYYIINTSSWDTLTELAKEKYLRQATLLIRNKITLDGTEDLFNLELATTHLAVYSIDKDMYSNDGKDNVKVLEIDGAIKKEYFSKGSKSNSFPSIVVELLQDYGFAGSNSFRIERS